MFKFIVSFISALETDNNRSATNSPDIITVSVGSVVTKLYDTGFIIWPLFILHAYFFGTWLYFSYIFQYVSTYNLSCICQRGVSNIDHKSHTVRRDMLRLFSPFFSLTNITHFLSGTYSPHEIWKYNERKKHSGPNKYYKKKNYQWQYLNHQCHTKVPRTKPAIRDS